MNILFVSAEPILPNPMAGRTHGSGGPAIAALPKALKHLDHRCRVIAPLFEQVDPSALGLARRLTKLSADVDGKTVDCDLYEGRTPGGVEVVFIGNSLFGGARSIDQGTDDEAARRNHTFAAAVVAYLGIQEQTPDVLHGQDGLGALVLSLAKKAGASPRRVLTLEEPQLHPTATIVAGVESADVVTTVSPSYADELRATSNPLAEALSRLGERFVGVLGGVDASIWNPATDAHLPSRFDPMDLNGKATCKSQLQRALSLPVRDDVPLIGVLANGAEDRGFDLLPAIVPSLLRNDCQCVVLWSGPEDHALSAAFRGFSERWPDRLQTRSVGDRREDHDLEHRLIGGSDLMLIPSRHEPCGYVQMCAHRYGTLPVVHRTGGLKDTVVDCDANLGSGNGFVFDEPRAEDLLGAVQRGLAAFQSMRAFTDVQRRAMRIDHSWDRSARIYEQLYRS